jgi:hypothetical protein
MKPPQNWVPLGLAVVACLAAGGCTDRRPADVADIKKSYVEFRTALRQNDYDRATNYVSSDLLRRHPNSREMLTNYFRGFLAPELELNPNARIEFDRDDRSKALLFPRRQAPTVGYGFLQEPNGWKITVNVVPVVPLF